MVREEGYDGVLRATDRVVGGDLGDLHRKAESLDAEAFGASKHLARAAWSPEMKCIGASLERHGAHQPDDAEHMVGVKVCEEDVAQREGHAVAHHLSLGAFTTIDQQRLSLAYDGDRRDVALDGRSRCGCAEEAQAQ